MDQFEYESIIGGPSLDFSQSVCRYIYRINSMVNVSESRLRYQRASLVLPRIVQRIIFFIEIGIRLCATTKKILYSILYIYIYIYILYIILYEPKFIL